MLLAKSSVGFAFRVPKQAGPSANALRCAVVKRRPVSALNVNRTAASHVGTVRARCTPELRPRAESRLRAVEAGLDAEAAELEEEGELEDDGLLQDILEGYNSVVKIHVTLQVPDWGIPWQSRAAFRSSGSGVLIEKRGEAGGLVLTAAHVVANSTYMEIQLPGSPDKIPARVVSVAHETDLALVEVDTGFAGVEPLVLADPDVLPRLRDKVYVLGFPVGGNDLSITEGVVSRIEVQSYSHSNARVLAATVDAAINSGNSGGPVVSQTTGEVVGIAFQGYAGSDVENQGHLVPAPLIGRFMASVAAGLSPDAAGLPGLGVHLQHLQSPSARSELKMKAHHTGVLVSHVECTGSSFGILRARDVVMEVDGVPIANDATCRLYGLRLAFISVLHKRFIGEVLPIKILRNGEEMVVDVELKKVKNLVARGQFDVSPPFFVVGGLVFQPLSLELLQTWQDLKDSPTHLMYMYSYGLPSPERKEVVVLTQLLADEANQGYSSEVHMFDTVQSVNGKAVPDMAAFVRAIQEARKEDFMEIALVNGELPSVVILDSKKVNVADDRILTRYHVPRRCSSHFEHLL